MTSAVIHGEGLHKPPALNLSGRIPELDGIRGIAIGLVLIAHFFEVVVRPGSPLAYAFVPLRLTWTGVDLFFVLSGFLIGGILLDARQSSNYFRVFYTRRFFRIVPIYALLLASVALGVTWSLAVEEQFYLTLPLLVRFLDRRSLLRFIFIAVVAAPLLRAFFFHHNPANIFSWYTLMPCRADSLLLGVLGALALRDPLSRAWLLGHRRLLSFALYFLVAGVILLGWRSPSPYQPFMATVGFTWLALTYLLFLLYALLFPSVWFSRCLRCGWLRGLGLIAYGTYLFHEFFLGMFFGRLPFIKSWRDLAVSIFTLAFTLLFCRLSWLYFEKPLVKTGHRASYQFDSKAGAPPSALEGGDFSAPEVA